jgi:hypothetical protein
MNPFLRKTRTEQTVKPLARSKQKRSWINTVAKTLPIRFDWWLKKYES